MDVEINGIKIGEVSEFNLPESMIQQRLRFRKTKINRYLFDKGDRSTLSVADALGRMNPYRGIGTTSFTGEFDLTTSAFSNTGGDRPSFSYTIEQLREATLQIGEHLKALKGLRLRFTHYFRDAAYILQRSGHDKESCIKELRIAAKSAIRRNNEDCKPIIEQAFKDYVGENL